MAFENLFVGQELFQKDVAVYPEQTEKLWFKKIPGVKFQTLLRIINDGEQDEREGAQARLIAQTWVLEDGDPACTYEQALMLDTFPLSAISNAVVEVHISRKGKQ